MSNIQVVKVALAEAGFDVKGGPSFSQSDMALAKAALNFSKAKFTPEIVEALKLITTGRGVSLAGLELGEATEFVAPQAPVDEPKEPAAPQVPVDEPQEPAEDELDPMVDDTEEEDGDDFDTE